jgi:hypothetical protein
MDKCADQTTSSKFNSRLGDVGSKTRAAGRSLLLGLTLAASASASATIFTFDFNSLVENDGNAQVQTYMRTIVPGVTVAGSDATRSYNGDGFVVGPTLGPDTFIRNLGSDHFTMDFGSSFHIYSISFDWEIFPDGSCYRSGTADTSGHAACANAGPIASNTNWPDFDLFVNHGATAVFSRVAVATAGAAAGSNYPQAIGTSGTINLAGVNFLDFVDWPATIAIDNLVINGCRDTADRLCVPPLKVPEPSPLPLLGAGLAAMLFAMRRRTIR